MRILLVGAALFLLCGAHADDLDRPAATRLMTVLQSQYGFTAAELGQVQAALEQARLLPQLIEAERNSKERILSWDAYRALHVTAANLAAGLRFMDQQRRWLARAQARYGVPPEVIAALLGVETKYGANSGRVRVLDALVTQGFHHPTRAAFFFEELTQFFVLCRDQHLDPTQPLGSYAGAMGMAQFMPSTWRRLAVDFDGDGSVDLWSAPDAIGSVANYLVNYDPQRTWRRDEPLLAAVLPSSQPSDALTPNLKFATYTFAGLRAGGIATRAWFPDTQEAGLVELVGNGGSEYWIALPNFYSVMAYNPRVFYAMTVAELAAALEQAQAAAPPDESAAR
jgi:membrane-bound lytic murein transglycosylase B